MENTLKNLHQILHQMLGFHRQLLELVRLEKEALVSANLKAIQETTYSKEALISAIQHAESERLKQVAELSVMLKKPRAELPLSQIIIEAQGKYPLVADQLRSLFNALTIMIQRIGEQNKENRVLAENFLSHIDIMKRNVLGEAQSQSQTYTQKGQRSQPGTQAAGSRLLSQEG